MRAIVQHGYGTPDVLDLEHAPRPTVGPREVLVRVHAAGLNRGDHHLLTGIPYLLRLGYGVTTPKHRVPGSDVAGTVEAVGAGVDHLRPGDAVFGWSASGALAEYARGPMDHFVHKPANLTMEQAATIPTSGGTALQGLRVNGGVGPGHRVLITGASGGVGSFAVQIARELGAEVTGVCSTRNVDHVRGLGADHVIDYTRTDFSASGRRYDFILDNVEAQPLSATLRVLARGGTLVTNSGSGHRIFGPLGRMIGERVATASTPAAIRRFLFRRSLDDLRELAELAAEGRVVPRLGRTFGLEGAADAMAAVAAGGTGGRVAVRVAPAHPATPSATGGRRTRTPAAVGG